MDSPKSNTSSLSPNNKNSVSFSLAEETSFALKTNDDNMDKSNMTMLSHDQCFKHEHEYQNEQTIDDKSNKIEYNNIYLNMDDETIKRIDYTEPEYQLNHHQSNVLTNDDGNYDTFSMSMIDSNIQEQDKLRHQISMIVEKIVADSVLQVFESSETENPVQTIDAVDLATLDSTCDIIDSHHSDDNLHDDDDGNDKNFADDQDQQLSLDVYDIVDDTGAFNNKNKKRNNNRNKRPSPAVSPKTTNGIFIVNNSNKQQSSNRNPSPKSTSYLSVNDKINLSQTNNKSTKSEILKQPKSNAEENIEISTNNTTILVEIAVEEKNFDSPTSSPSSSNNLNLDNNNKEESSKAKMNGIKSYGSNHLNGGNESMLCKICSKHVYHMEQIKAVKSVFHKSCFRCVECNKQLNMDSYSSHEGLIYCKPHFKQLFQPKPIFDNNNHQQQNGSPEDSTNGRRETTKGITGKSTEDITVQDQEAKKKKDKDEEYLEDNNQKLNENKKPRKYELIICENQPKELPADVVRYDSKQQDVFENLTLDLSNIRNRFENGSISSSHNSNNIHNSEKPIARSESIHKIMQKYQSRVAGDNCVSSSSDEEDNISNTNKLLSSSNNHHHQDDKEKVSFTGMSTLKSQWETGSINTNVKSQSDSRSVENELAELRKKGKSSEPLTKVYERAIQEAQSTENLSSNKGETVLVDGCSIKAGSIKEKFEKGALETETEEDRIERLRKEREAEITQISNNDAALKEARNKFKQIEANMGKEPHLLSNVDSSSNGHLEDVSIDFEQLQQRFNYFENLNGNHAKDDEIDHSVKIVDDIPKVDTTKMLSKFKALEAGQVNGSDDMMNGGGNTPGPKMPKRITPPRETAKIYENEPLVERDPNIVKSSYKNEDVIQVEPEKAKYLRAKFENWQTEIERENRKNNLEEENDFVPLERDTTKNLRAMFESIQNETKPVEKPRPRVNRFVDRMYQQSEICYVCSLRIYPMEKMEFSGIKLHKNCFRCTKCHMPLRLDNFTQHADRLFCIPHFKQLFMEKGNYDEGFGLEQHKDKWSNKCASTTSVNGNGDMNCKANGSTTSVDKKTTNGTNGIHHHHDEENNVATDSDEQLDSIEYHQNYYEPSNRNGTTTGGGLELVEDY